MSAQRGRVRYAEMIEEPAKSGIPVWAWVVGGAALAVLLVGGGAVGFRVAIRSNPSSKEDNPANVIGPSAENAPLVQVNPWITTAEFGGWRLSSGKDHVGKEEAFLIGSIKAIGYQSVEPKHFEAVLFNADGTIRDRVEVGFAVVNPGQIGEARIRLSGKVAKIIIDFRSAR